MLLVDIAVPRDVEPEVGKLANAYLYSVDDLQNIIQHNLAQRKAAAVQAETIVEQEASEFMAWLALRAPARLSANMLPGRTGPRGADGKALAALNQGGDAQEIMQDLARKLTNRLITRQPNLFSRPPVTGMMNACIFCAKPRAGIAHLSLF